MENDLTNKARQEPHLLPGKYAGCRVQGLWPKDVCGVGGPRVPAMS